MEAIDLDKPLPQCLAIESVDNELYRIGCLCRSPTQTNVYNHNKNRSLFYNPIVVDSVLVIQAIKSIISFVSNEETLALYLGDFPRMSGVGYTMHVVIVYFSALSLSVHLIHGYNDKHGVNPSFLRVFQMMSGSLTPRQIGLTNVGQIRSLLSRTKASIRAIRANCKYLITLFCFTVSIMPYLVRPISQAVIYGLPNAIFFTCFGHYGWRTAQTNGFFCHMLCLYIKCRIKNTNTRITQTINSYQRLNQIHWSLNSIYTEINEYNETFLSKYYLSVWLILGSLDMFILYIAIIQRINIIYNLIYSYAFVMLFAMFSFIVLNASSVNTEANYSYKILNSLFVRYSASIAKSKLNRRQTCLKLFKLKLLIERVSEGTVGFSCWNWFTINYFKSYEILSLLSLLFLKIIDFNRNGI